MALVLESRFTKDQILELYLNDVVLGQRGPFEIHGVVGGRAHLLRQGRAQRHARRGRDDRRPHPVAVAPVAVPQSRARARTPQRRAAARWPTTGSSTADEAEKAAKEPLGRRHARARERGAVLRRLRQPARRREVRGLLEAGRRRRRLHDARPAAAAPRAGSAGRGHGAGRQAAGRAQDARAGAGGARRRRSAHRRDPRAGRRPRLQPVAVQPRRHRAAPAGIGLQAVRVSGGVRADGRRGPHGPHAGDRRSSTSRRPSRTARTTTRRPTTRTSTTARSRCAGRSRSRATSSPSRSRRQAGYDRVADALERGSASARPRRPIRRSRSASSRRRRSRWPTAYTLFTNGGAVRPLQADHAASSRTARRKRCRQPPHRDSRAADTTYPRRRT